MSDETFYDVKVLLPVTVRFWADTEQAAKEQFCDTEMSLTGPMHSFSIGFPLEMTIEEINDEHNRTSAGGDRTAADAVRHE